jgi:hypothetical protein
MRGIARTFATALTVLMLAAFQRPSTGNEGQIKILSGFTHASASAQRIAENRLAAFLSPTRVDHDFRELTREPHVAGSDRNNELAHL